MVLAVRVSCQNILIFRFYSTRKILKTFYKLQRSIKSMVDEGKFENQFEHSDDFRQAWKKRVRDMLTEQEWRRRKLTMRISEEEGRVKKEEEETREMWKHKREHEEKWEETRENRVSSWRDFQKGGKKAKRGELRPPKLKTEDPNKSYVQRPVKKG